MTPLDLLARWADTADDLERFGATAQAQAVRTCAAELRAALESHGAELLDLGQAATESGYSKRRLRELVAEGQLQNRGRHGAPRFRRDELPRKATTETGTGFDVDAEVSRLLT